MNERREHWDHLASWYNDDAQWFSLQGLITCVLAGSVRDDGITPQRILEVACGPGLHSRLIAESFLRPNGGVLVSTDFSMNMLEYVKESYKGSDYSLVEGNKYLIDETFDSSESSTEKCDIESIIRSQGDFRKFVYACCANNECLPFPDQSFTAYISNLSLMLVKSPKSQLKEAYRVLKPNARAVFTIWGRREKTYIDHAIGIALESIMNTSQKDAAKAVEKSSHYDLSEGKLFNIEDTLKEIGFHNIKIWYQPMNFMIYDGESAVEWFKFSLDRQGKDMGLDEDQMKELKVKTAEVYDQATGKDTTNMKSFEIQVIAASRL